MCDVCHKAHCAVVCRFCMPKITNVNAVQLHTDSSGYEATFLVVTVGNYTASSSRLRLHPAVTAVSEVVFQTSNACQNLDNDNLELGKEPLTVLNLFLAKL